MVAPSKATTNATHANGVNGHAPPRITASYVFLRTLYKAGVTHCFVNLGSDHPALLEAFADSVNHQIEGMQIVTCPHEMVALSCAQGYAQQCGTPAAVIVHVDVGTQNLGGAIHNVDRDRVPVIIFAGASPFTFFGEKTGTRNEFINYLQDVHDQPAIVRQYMRYVGQINSGTTMASTTLRALQISQSEPMGPSYLWARREIMEEEVDAEHADVDTTGWSPIEKVGLSAKAVKTISDALLAAKKPVIVTSYVGRNPAAVPLLVKLSETLAVPVQLASPSTVNIAIDHPHVTGPSYGRDDNPVLRDADVVLVVDSDVPWVPVVNVPNSAARVFKLDVDPLKKQFAYHLAQAEINAACDAELALSQLLEAVEGKTGTDVEPRREKLARSGEDRMRRRAEVEAFVPENGTITVPYVLSELRKILPPRTWVASEAISNYGPAIEHLSISKPGMLRTSGASSLGYALGAAIGAHLASRVRGEEHDLTLAVVGDGSYLFAVPSTAYWIARRYDAPFLTVILNNGGWKSPRYSALAVHPNGSTSKASMADIHVGFGPHPVDYCGVASAAGNAWGRILKNREDVVKTVAEAVRVVREEKRCAVLDVHLDAFC